jgi:hypothetical protein
VCVREKVCVCVCVRERERREEREREKGQNMGKRYSEIVAM